MIPAIETIMDVDICLLVKETCDCVVMDICLIFISIHLCEQRKNQWFIFLLKFYIENQQIGLFFWILIEQMSRKASFTNHKNCSNCQSGTSLRMGSLQSNLCMIF